MGENAKILVVDDDERIRRIIKVILENEGYIVDIAATGKEATGQVEKTSYDVALLDIRLPDLEGVELLKLLKDAAPRTRMIMVTGYPSKQNAIAALNNKADAYLLKPLDVGVLLEVVRGQLRIREQENESSMAKVAEFIETRVRELSFYNPSGEQ